MSTSSSLFDKAGYISLSEYVKDIYNMIENGPWKLPLGSGDRFRLFLLRVVLKFSWFLPTMYILHSSKVSPSYSALLTYLKKNLFFDSFSERSLGHRNYFYFCFEKQISLYGKVFIMSGQGVSEDKATAFSIALGEMLERIISGVHDMNKNIVITSYKELSQECSVLYPPSYHRFLEVQKNKHKELNFNSNDKISWVRGENLITQETTYIPKQITLWFDENRNMKKIFMNATTNGSAGYFTKEGAVLRGILEVVQRDGFLVHWLTMIPPQVIVRETLPMDIQKRIQDFELFGLSIHVLNITALSVPSVLIVVINNQAEIPQVVVAGASDLTFEDAIWSALKEVVIITEIFYYTDTVSDISEPFISDLSKMGRQLYWRGKNKVERFQWFLGGKKVTYQSLCLQSLPSQTDDLSKLSKVQDVLSGKGGDYYPVVYYPENKVQEKVGFYVAQVYIPKAFPFYLVEKYGTFDSDRLVEFAESQKVFNWNLNPEPHMFS